MSEWQPIETAPKDWSNVLVFDAARPWSNDFGVFLAWWDMEDESWTAHEGEFIALSPTHWMPLPPPPTSKGEGDE